MTPPATNDIQLTTNGHGRVKISLPIKALVAVVTVVLTAVGGWSVRPYLDPEQAAARPPIAGAAVNLDSQRVDVLSLLLKMNDTLGGLSERVVRIEANTLYMAKDVERLSKDTSENQKNLDTLRGEVAKLRERDVILEK